MELSLIFEFWPGESLLTEMTLGLRRERSLLVSAALVIVPAPLVATCSDGSSALCSAWWWWCLQSREAFVTTLEAVRGSSELFFMSHFYAFMSTILLRSVARG